MDEQHVPPPSAPDSQPPEKVTPSSGQQRRRQKSVFQYITIMFAAAFVLMLFTFLMERRQYQLLNQQNQEQIDNLQQSVSAVQSLQNLYDENDTLKKRVDELEDQLMQLQSQHRQDLASQKSLTQEAEQLQRTVQALAWFWQIDEAYVRQRYTLCRSLIQEFQALALVESLPKENATTTERYAPYDRYQEIYNRLF